MKALIQRVSRARVTVEGAETGAIGKGYAILLGVRIQDTEADALYLAEKVASLRIFPDAQGKMNLALSEVDGAVLVVSQFTLYADTRKGNRPSFIQAAAPAEAERLYEVYVSQLRRILGPDKVATGVFRANMSVEIVNDGPVTIELCSDSRNPEEIGVQSQGVHPGPERGTRSRTVVITGGAQGIGKAMARRFLAEGFAVVIADEDEEAGCETAEAYASFGTIRFIPTNVASEKDVIRLVAETMLAFGGIEVLINNAAISCNQPVAELSLADWERVIGVNLTGPFLCAKHFASALRQSHGSIINIASTRALMSEPNTEAYSASKGGMVALTHALAASLAPDVRVNCISPGWIETGAWAKAGVRTTPVHSAADKSQHWVGRVGQPEDIASLSVYLASDASGFITGSNMVVDGGMTHKMIYG